MSEYHTLTSVTIVLFSKLNINKINNLQSSFNPLFQESEPISNYLSSDISQEVKQRIAKMGVDTLLKMVRYISH